MAGNLMRAGYSLVVHHRTRAEEEELVSSGASAADSLRDVGSRGEVLITMLPDSADVEQIHLARAATWAPAGGRCRSWLAARMKS